MIEYEKALKIIRKAAANYQVSSIEIPVADSLGYVLSEDVLSDINMPPFDKSAMDGYACKYEDLTNELEVIDYIPAGAKPSHTISPGTCAKIMTGAKVPEGADTVFMVEYSKQVGGNKIYFTGKNTKSNICKLGEDVKVGDKVLKKGDIISPASIGILASVGRINVKVVSSPDIALIATGDELIEPYENPNEVQIRNSNSYNIMAQISETKSRYNYLGIVKDDKKSIRSVIKGALDESDMLILTGGVSMGDRDYVPEILSEFGLEVVFDSMAIQPGKPVAYAHGNQKFCFALSGNPVSSLLQFELLVKPFIYYSMNGNYRLPVVQALLGQEKQRKKTERKQFFPIAFENGMAYPIEFHGSAHIAGLHYADGFGIFPLGKTKLNRNEPVDILLLKR